MNKNYKAITKLTLLLDTNNIKYRLSEGHIIISLPSTPIGMEIKVMEHDLGSNYRVDMFGCATRLEWAYKKGYNNYISIDEALKRIVYCVAHDTLIYKGN